MAEDISLEAAFTHAYANQPTNYRPTCAANKDECDGNWIVHGAGSGTRALRCSLAARRNARLVAGRRNTKVVNVAIGFQCNGEATGDTSVGRSNCHAVTPYARVTI